MELAGGGGDCQRGALQSMLSSGEAHSSEARPDWLMPLWRNFTVVWREADRIQRSTIAGDN